jgi:hypothetical protein
VTRTIHLVFKTHLDIGFTDHAAKVRAQYHERFIPQAIETGEHFYAEDPAAPKFVWTTGAWLIWDHLNSQPPERVRRLERAIERGLISWHALPYTTHSELMSPAVFRAGLSYAQELDRRFGRKTTAAKMTDVPGHTLGIVPLLAEAGVQFLHLGVNAASPVPDVPDAFRWRAPDGSEIVVQYQKSYGETAFLPGFTTGLGFAHTNDNLGPQSVPQTIDVLRDLSGEHPDATIKASTLDAYGELLWARRDELPIVELELGDSWIYGVASDPSKVKRYLGYQRHYDRLAEQGRGLGFGRALGMVAEHTWGVDIKQYLRDQTGFDRPAFEALRASDYRFKFTEASWAEQNAYLDTALAELDESERPADELVPVGDLAGWQVETDPVTGGVAAITSPSGKVIRGEGGSLMGFRYESYTAADIDRWLDTYLTQRPYWAPLDHAKPGLENAATARSQVFAPSADGTLDPEAHAELGAPARISWSFRGLDANRLELAVTLHDKPANRMPEASFVSFTPAGEHDWQFLKTGLWLRADKIAPRGGGQLQAVAGARTEGVNLTPLDTPLVAPAHTDFMEFDKLPPDFSAGLRFNLHNNKWGTNFAMWWGAERFTARFLLELTQ